MLPQAGQAAVVDEERAVAVILFGPISAWSVTNLKGINELRPR